VIKANHALNNWGLVESPHFLWDRLKYYDIIRLSTTYSEFVQLILCLAMYKISHVRIMNNAFNEEKDDFVPTVKSILIIFLI